MTEFRRYAVYYLPPEGPLARFGASWLGWDVLTGRPAAQPAELAPGLDLAAITATPRKYGFHATVKPPFRLAEGESAGALAEAFAAFCASAAPVRMEALRLSRLGSFLALAAEGDPAPLRHLAAAAVRDLDRFRAPAPEAEMARRRGRGLSPAQEENLQRWGYPYVMEEFRFHMTLTGSLRAPGLAERAEAVLGPALAPLLPAPFEIGTLCLAGADREDRFRLIARHPLGGPPAP
ncbi:DUF1045 domain-containing protein [Poseidonocella sp. HB161398]|uniref:DUF1045 domain-containing protein n=1 Tax=Poseidonocella sp. HB161398 TaxID=2320855 RepID=UPI001108A362|nr:DUF1045 domain-containing protein [Poseidonocella sp. HB161398]